MLVNGTFGARTIKRRNRKEVEHNLREFVRALDLWHMADAGEQMCLGVRHDTPGIVQVMCGQHAIAVAPDDQSGARVLRCGTG